MSGCCTPQSTVSKDTGAVIGASADTYAYDRENRLISLNRNSSGGTGTYGYEYDYRICRVVRDESSAGGKNVHLTFSGGLAVQEFDQTPKPPELDVTLIRGSDYGGGVGGMLYSVRSGVASYAHANARGDITSKTDGSGAVTWQAAYEADGTRTVETAPGFATNQCRQRGNTKDEDSTGLLNEGMRHRDLESGVFLTRDPAGFVDGPNLYAYVRQNPWAMIDPLGLSGKEWYYYLENNTDISKAADQLDIDRNSAEYGVIMKR